MSLLFETIQVYSSCDCYGTETDCEGTTTSSSEYGCRWVDDGCTEQTEEPTLQPTQSPTCPDYSGHSNPCSFYEESCCPTSNGLCKWSTSNICQSEGGMSIF